MPMGLDTPSTLGLGLFVLLPALKEAQATHLDHHAASVFAWNVGMVVLVFLGLFNALMSPMVHWVRRALPRAGLLGSLAGIALAVIAFLPMAKAVAAVPLLGIPTLALILTALLAKQAVKVPGVVTAFLLGMVLYLAGVLVGEQTGVLLVSLPDVSVLPLPGEKPGLPPGFWTWGWWQPVLVAAVAKLPIVLPFALAVLVGSMECIESAAAAGDEYTTISTVMAQGLTTAAAGLCGGVVQVTPYFGHPAYKEMGARAGYTILTAVFLGLAGFMVTIFRDLFAWLPQAVLFPIIVYVGMETIAHSYRSTPPRHFAALAAAAIPVLAFISMLAVDQALGVRKPDPNALPFLQTLRCLSNGFILTGLLWACIIAALIDRELIRAAILLLIAGGCALIGLIHSPLPNAPLALPTEVYYKLQGIDRIQSPIHWAAGYGLAALFVFLYGLRPNLGSPERTDAASSTTPPAASAVPPEPVGVGEA
jgi:AGZA family xanthine/uracil permease-like MFS transporter